MSRPRRSYALFEAILALLHDPRGRAVAGARRRGACIEQQLDAQPCSITSLRRLSTMRALVLVTCPRRRAPPPPSVPSPCGHGAKASMQRSSTSGSLSEIQIGRGCVAAISGDGGAEPELVDLLPPAHRGRPIHRRGDAERGDREPGTRRRARPGPRSRRMGSESGSATRSGAATTPTWTPSSCRSSRPRQCSGAQLRAVRRSWPSRGRTTAPCRPRWRRASWPRQLSEEPLPTARAAAAERHALTQEANLPQASSSPAAPDDPLAPPPTCSPPRPARLPRRRTSPNHLLGATRSRKPFRSTWRAAEKTANGPRSVRRGASRCSTRCCST